MDLCKFCGVDKIVKEGFIRGKQRYRCKNCGRCQIDGDMRIKYSNETRNQAIEMYINSYGFRSIGRTLNVPYQLVVKWVENSGEIVE